MSSLTPIASLLDAARVPQSLGAWLVGTFLSILGDGMLLQQTMRYYRLYPNDPYFLKIWVFSAVLFQLITTAMATHTAYYYLITYFYDPIVFTKNVPWTTALVPLFGPIANAIAESFFARRVFLVGPKYRIFAFSGLIMVLMSCGFYIAQTVQVFTLHSIVATVGAGGWLPPTGAAFLLAGDVQLTGILVYVLQRGRSGIKRTDSMVNMLIMYAISTGSLVCVINTVSLVLALVFPHQVLYAAANMVGNTIYSNSFVVALNTRELVRARGELDNTHFDTGVVLSDGRVEVRAAKQVELPLRSMVFAHGTSATQLTSTTSAFYDSQTDGTAAEQDANSKASSPDINSEMNKGHSKINVLATV
ncbi:hypothetical protein PYCCODRAFT_1052139 [Trametes coccinea BRFM310]|uniref:DUF6534 domain-containing protein n=1 Tax=Trametes coccinea (strain BRFM310) TaxID=1353009 RepID=A0A1Y2IXM9_TRAC3|nr:hypothetical protein PYCCODRAFT_1052139 [Trametes coccinea BRFM310]